MSCLSLSFPTVDTVSKVDDRNIDTACVGIEREDGPNFLRSHSKRTFLGFMQTLKVYRNCFAIKFSESPSHNLYNEVVRKMVLGKKLICLTRKIERPVH